MKSKSKKTTTIEEKLPFKAKKTDHNIPIFGVKSALVIMLFAALGSYVTPLVLSHIGVPFAVGVIIGNTLITPFGICYSRFFIETKRGYTKKFLYLYLAFAAVSMVISALWMIKGIYI